MIVGHRLGETKRVEVQKRGRFRCLCAKPSACDGWADIEEVLVSPHSDESPRALTEVAGSIQWTQLWAVLVCPTVKLDLSNLVTLQDIRYDCAPLCNPFAAMTHASAESPRSDPLQAAVKVSQASFLF